MIAISQTGLSLIKGYTCRSLRLITHNDFKECHQRAMTALKAKEISDKVQPVYKSYQVELKSLKDSKLGTSSD